MTKYQTAATLLKMMYDANNADNETASAWQTPDMAGSDHLYGDLQNALIKVIGQDLYDYIMAGDGICIWTAKEVAAIEGTMIEESAVTQDGFLNDPKEYAEKLVEYFLGHAGAALNYYSDPKNEDRVFVPGVGIKYQNAVAKELHKLADTYYANHKDHSSKKQLDDLKKHGRAFI